MSIFDKLYQKGVNEVKNKKVVFCGMVRDSEKEVRRNIPVLEKMASYFADYRIVILENNSEDDTKKVLNSWMNRNPKMIALCNDFDERKYDEIPREPIYNKYKSRRRIQKYDDYRNMYCDYVEYKLNFESDYYIEIDLDIAKIDVKGFITSFGNDIKWNAITANGYSYNMWGKRRYHDTYCLIESGKEHIPQSEESIMENQKAFEPLRKGMPFIRVAAAMGGMIIFKTKERISLRYHVIPNNFGGIEVLCDHVSIFYQLAERGYDKFYINPNLIVYYQAITLKHILVKIKNIFLGYY